MAVSFSQPVTDNAHWNIVVAEKIEQGKDAGAGLDDLLDRFAAEFMKRAVNQQARRLFHLFAKIRERFVFSENQAGFEDGVIEKFKGAEHARVDMANRGSIHIKQY